MDPLKLKVVQLRAELTQRGLDSRGIKSALVQRLQASLAQETQNPSGSSSQTGSTESSIDGFDSNAINKNKEMECVFVDDDNEETDSVNISLEPEGSLDVVQDMCPPIMIEDDDYESRKIDVFDIIKNTGDEEQIENFVADAESDDIQNMNVDPISAEAMNLDENEECITEVQEDVEDNSINDFSPPTAVEQQETEKTALESIEIEEEIPSIVNNDKLPEIELVESEEVTSVPEESIAEEKKPEAIEEKNVAIDDNSTANDKSEINDNSSVRPGGKHAHSAVSESDAPLCKQPRKDDQNSGEIKFLNDEDEPEFDSEKVLLNWYDSDLNLKIDINDFATAKPLSDSAFGLLYAGARASYGVKSGKVVYEIQLIRHNSVPHFSEELYLHELRTGWSTLDSDLQLGEHVLSYAYSSVGKKCSDNKADDYGCEFSIDDVIGCYLDLDANPCTIQYTVNNKIQGVAFEFDKSELNGKALFPHVLTKNIEYKVNFGQCESSLLNNIKDKLNVEEVSTEIPAEQTNAAINDSETKSSEEKLDEVSQNDEVSTENNLPTSYDILNGYEFINKVPIDELCRGPERPSSRKDCEVIMMIGLPGAGKTYWVENHNSTNQEKKYCVLNTNSILKRMKIFLEPRGKNQKIQWEKILELASRNIVALHEIACKRRKNYILDQTNVYPSVQQRKMRSFGDFKRIAVVVVPNEEEFNRRYKSKLDAAGDTVPDSTMNEMKANFVIPILNKTNSVFTDIIFTDLDENLAVEEVANYNAKGNAEIQKYKNNRDDNNPKNKIRDREKRRRWGGAIDRRDNRRPGDLGNNSGSGNNGSGGGNWHQMPNNMGGGNWRGEPGRGYIERYRNERNWNNSSNNVDYHRQDYRRNYDRSFGRNMSQSDRYDRRMGPSDYRYDHDNRNNRDNRRNDFNRSNNSGNYRSNNYMYRDYRSGNRTDNKDNKSHDSKPVQWSTPNNSNNSNNWSSSPSQPSKQQNWGGSSNNWNQQVWHQSSNTTSSNPSSAASSNTAGAGGWKNYGQNNANTSSSQPTNNTQWHPYFQHPPPSNVNNTNSTGWYPNWSSFTQSQPSFNVGYNTAPPNSTGADQKFNSNNNNNASNNNTY